MFGQRQRDWMLERFLLLSGERALSTDVLRVRRVGVNLLNKMLTSSHKIFKDKLDGSEWESLHTQGFRLPSALLYFNHEQAAKHRTTKVQQMNQIYREFSKHTGQNFIVKWMTFGGRMRTKGSESKVKETPHIALHISSFQLVSSYLISSLPKKKKRQHDNALHPVLQSFFAQVFSIKRAHTALIDDFRQVVHFLAMRSLLHEVINKLIASYLIATKLISSLLFSFFSPSPSSFIFLFCFKGSFAYNFRCCAV